MPTDQKYIKQVIEGGIGELPDGVLGKWTEDATQPEQDPPPMLQTSVPISDIILLHVIINIVFFYGTYTESLSVLQWHGGRRGLGVGGV